MSIFTRIKSSISVTATISILVALTGLVIINHFVIKSIGYIDKHFHPTNTWKTILNFFDLLDIPQFIIGVALVLIAFALLIKMRVAWFFSIILLCFILSLNIFVYHNFNIQTILATISMLCLILNWKKFNYHSLAAGTYFSVVSIASLIVYSILGTLYLGEQFSPVVTNLSTAFYYVIVCMTTVGFGDIVPHSSEARFFTITILIFGMAVVAGSVASVAGPIINNHIAKMNKQRGGGVNRNNHFILIGVNMITASVYQNLTQRNDHVTVICSTDNKSLFPDGADIIESVIPPSINDLKRAGVDTARCIVLLCDNDADNALTLLSVKQCASPEAKLAVMVNDSDNIVAIKQINPTFVFSLPRLGSEILVRTLLNDITNNELFTAIFFGESERMQ